MASIVARSGKFQAFVRRAGHPTLCRTFPSKRAAERWARELEQQLASGLDVATRTLADAIDVYLGTEPGDRLNGYEQGVLEWWRDRLGTRRLQELKRGDFYAARDALHGVRGGPLAPATKNRRLALIAAVLSHAVNLDWLPANPSRIRRLTEDNLVERPVTAAEIDALQRACRMSPEPWLYALVVTAICSGARAGELQRLVWRDIDLEAGVAGLLKTKSGRRRPIPIRGAALEELLRMHDVHGGEPGDHVFRRADGRAPFEYGPAWRAARAAAGLQDLRFHDLRHLAASTLAAAGTSTRELMAFLGHSNPSTTARYAHLVDRHIVALGDILSEKLLGSIPAA